MKRKQSVNNKQYMKFDLLNFFFYINADKRSLSNKLIKTNNVSQYF